MKSRSDKKGQVVGGYDIGIEAPYDMAVVIVLAVMAVLLVVVMYKYVATIIYFPENFKETISIYRFVNSPNCVAYEDLELRRVYPGVMDWDRFKDNSYIGKCYSTESKKAAAFRLILKRPGGIRQIQTNNWNEEREFDVERNRYVLIMENNQLERGDLSIAIQKNQ